eukprot:8321543-Lingulodinium_polyedra.AAC.1
MDMDAGAIAITAESLMHGTTNMGAPPRRNEHLAASSTGPARKSNNANEEINRPETNANQRTQRPQIEMQSINAIMD